MIKAITDEIKIQHYLDMHRNFESLSPKFLNYAKRRHNYGGELLGFPIPIPHSCRFAFYECLRTSLPQISI